MYKLPKNIRQIGQVEGNKKVYVEDYVITFTKQLVKKEYGNYSFAILLGNYAKIEGCKNIFINGAIEIDNMVYGEMIHFSNEVWTSIYENIKKYFTETEIVGWYIGGAGLTLEVDTKIVKAHMDNFAGQDKILYMYDSMDQDDVFFVYDNNNLVRQEGYYIYYERNEEMQNYMIDKQGGKSSEENYEDKAIKEIRQVIQGKKEEVEHKNIVKILYGASAVLAIIVLVIGATMLKNYDQMKNMQDALQAISNNFSGDDNKNNKDGNTVVDENNSPDPNKTDDKEVTEVETINGNISSSEDDQNNNNKDSKNQDEDNQDATNDLDNEVAKNNTDKKVETSQDNDDNKNDTTPQDDNKADSSDKDKKNINKDDKKDDKKEETSKDNAHNEGNVEKTSQYYIVKKDDTLASICLTLYHSLDRMNEIKELNNIEDKDKILIGQKLMLP